MTKKNNKVTLQQLRKGVYIELQGNWLNHPFLVSQFKITSAKQIKKLEEYGILSVTFNADKSDVLPLTEEQLANKNNPRTDNESIVDGDIEEDILDEILTDVAEEEILDPFSSEELEKTRDQRREQQKQRNRDIQRCEKRFKKTVSTVKNVMNTLRSRPIEAITEASEMIDETVASLLSEADVIVNVMNEKSLDENAYFHSMNVSILSLLLGKIYGLGKEEMKNLGIGALFHDMGKARVADSILNKQTPLTKVEFKALSLHPFYGAELAKKIAGFPDEAIEIVEQHHEKLNGKGYPKQLKADEISLLSRIAIIANTYDNHCNHGDVKRDLTPHEALSFMYVHQKEEIDQKLLKMFVHRLGIYPPGSIVQLSNDNYALVISVNSKCLLHPKLILYSKIIPREEAIIYDMADDKTISITRAIRPAKLDNDVYNYLSPRKNIQYSYDSVDSDDE